jgi:hypothetical protein
VGVEEGPQGAKGREADPRPILDWKLVARYRVQHPPRDGDLPVVGQANHHDVIVSPAQCPN